MRNFGLMLICVFVLFSCAKDDADNKLEKTTETKDNRLAEIQELENSLSFSEFVNVYDTTESEFIVVKISTSSLDLLKEYVSYYNNLNYVSIPRSDIDRFSQQFINDIETRDVTETTSEYESDGFVRIDIDLSNIINKKTKSQAITFLNKKGMLKTIQLVQNISGNPSMLTCTPACDAAILYNQTNYWCSNCLCSYYNACWEVRDANNAILTTATSSTQLEVELFEYTGQISKIYGWPGFNDGWSHCQIVSNYSAKSYVYLIIN